MSFVKRKGVLQRKGLKFALTLFKDAVGFSSLGGLLFLALKNVIQCLQVMT